MLYDEVLWWDQVLGSHLRFCQNPHANKPGEVPQEFSFLMEGAFILQD